MEFLPASITDIPLPIDYNIEPEIAVSAEEAGTCSKQNVGTVLNSSITSTNKDIFSQKSPIPKRQQLTRKKIGNRRKTIAAVLTYRPEKEMLPSASRRQCTPKFALRKNPSPAESSDSSLNQDIFLHDSSADDVDKLLMDDAVGEEIPFAPNKAVM